MEKITLTCNKGQKFDSSLAVYFHGWLMGKVSSDFADQIHTTGTNPLNIYVYQTKDYINFVVCLLTQKAVDEIFDILLDDNFTSFTLQSSEQNRFDICEKYTESLSEEELARSFYSDDAENLFTIQVLTPMAFKTQGQYFNLPDIRLFFQSLMKKYNSVFEGSEHVDIDLLDEIVKRTVLINFNINSRRYYIHHAYINGFMGRLTFLCKGSKTLTNYINTLLSFAEYSGAGVKTSLGMGAIKAVDRKD